MVHPVLSAQHGDREMRRVLNEVMETVALPPRLAKSVRDAIRD